MWTTFFALNLDSRSFDRAGYLLPYMISRGFSIAFVISSFVEVHSQNTAGHERKFLFLVVTSMESLYLHGCCVTTTKGIS